MIERGTGCGMRWAETQWDIHEHPVRQTAHDETTLPVSHITGVEKTWIPHYSGGHCKHVSSCKDGLGRNPVGNKNRVGLAYNAQGKQS